MQNSSNKQTNIQDMLADTLRNFANTSMEAYKPFLQNITESVTSAGKNLLKGDYANMKMPKLFKETCNCCPPDCECPPHCMAAINRTAAQHERILVPFMIKNTCSHAKTYKVGIRELKDQDGKPAPDQPHLNKHSVTLEPGASERVIMALDLGKFENGDTYSTEIVIREKDINQNICFTLKIDNDANLVTACPQNENQYKLKWQSWQSHYYCEPKQHNIQQGMPVIKN